MNTSLTVPPPRAREAEIPIDCIILKSINIITFFANPHIILLIVYINNEAKYTLFLVLS